MLAETLIILKKIKKGDLDRRMLKPGIIAELGGINSYEPMTAMKDGSCQFRLRVRCDEK